MDHLKFIDLCCIGGFHQALIVVKCVLASDIDRECQINLTKYGINQKVISTKIHEINTKLDVLCVSVVNHFQKQDIKVV